MRTRIATMLLNRFQIETARVALAWAARGCSETVRNGGSCIDEVHRQYGTAAREAYCAELAYVVAAQAARAAGIANPLPRTRGACAMLEQSIARGLRVDKEPAVGAIGYHGSDPKYATGHISIVVDVTSTHMRTVEGNNDDKIDDWLYPLHTVRNRPETQRCQRGRGWTFIHIEDAGGSPTFTLQGLASSTRGPSPLAFALAAGAIATGYALTRVVWA